MSPLNQSKIQGYFWLALSMCLVGSYVALSKQLLVAFPPLALAWIRFLIAFVFMLPWLFEWKNRWRSVTKHDVWVLFGMSFFGNFLFTICMLFGVGKTSVAAAGIVMSLLPATIAVLSVLILREHLTKMTILSLVLAVIGVALLSMQKSNEGQSWLGNMFMVGALLCEGLYVIGGKYLSAGYSPKQVAVSMNTTGLLLSMPLGLHQSVQINFSDVSFYTWALMIFYSVSASQIAPWLWFRGIKSVTANRAGIVTIALPLTTALFSIVWFGETWTSWHTLAFACALVGILLVTRSDDKS